MIKAEEFMMLKDRPNQGESRGALGERRQSLPQSRFCPEKKQNFVHQNTLAYYMPPPLISDFPTALWWKQEEDYNMGLQQQ